MHPRDAFCCVRQARIRLMGSPGELQVTSKLSLSLSPPAANDLAANQGVRMKSSPPVVALTVVGVIIAIVSFLAAANFAFTSLGLIAIVAAAVIQLTEQRANAPVPSGAGGGSASSRALIAPPALWAIRIMWIVSTSWALFLIVAWFSVAIHSDPGELIRLFGWVTAGWLFWTAVTLVLHRRHGS